MKDTTTNARPDTRPTATPEPDLIVGLGASAGGVGALKELFSHVPAQTGAAYVVILHLSPDHDSKLAEVLQTTAHLPVTQVRGGVAIHPDHVYVIPPNASLSITDGHLVLSPFTGLEQRHAPVDVFFRALAEAHGARAVTVVLSGTGPDGSAGVKRVKERGGLAIAQDPEEAEYEDMPRNSIATGLVDQVLPVAAIPQAIIAYRDRLQRPQPADQPAAGAEPDVSALREVITLLRVRTGQDFANYKPATIMRRIDRRLHVHQLPDMRAYAQFLRDHPDELPLLLNELLISVTNFFRDPDAYTVLERRIIPRLFLNKQSNDQVRVWAAGCATGEEAYSIAMLLAEAATELVNAPSLQVFATDLDERAINIGREGFYNKGEVADLSDERLRRFFVKERDGYRIRRELREIVLFARHNVIKDPPFSHLDLIACRNVLIYLNRSAQERLLDAFHFALRPGGFLFLGASETADTASDLFIPAEKTAHIYESRTVTSRPIPSVYDIPQVAVRLPVPLSDTGPAERVSAADLHLRLLEEYAPPSMVITEDHQVLHVSEAAARYLGISPGEPSRDIVKLVLPEFRVDLRTALYQAARQRSSVQVQGVQVPAARGGGHVSISVRPVLRDGDPPRGYFLVLFEQDTTSPARTDSGVQLTSPTDAPISQLEHELARAKAQLRATIEQYESQVEEAKGSNEELQAMNEELRSAAEELETSKEELQSVNEELTTVNQELKVKIEELALTNNDFQNFINSTEIATIFLDRAQRVKLFTVRSRDVFNLLPGDVGRRLSDITSSLRYERLHADVSAVLERLQPVEQEVETYDGRWFLMRVLPYRTSDDRIDGVVITFLEITQRRLAETRLRTGEERLRLLIDSAIDYAIFTLTEDGHIDFWNAGAKRLFGFAADEIIGQKFDVLFTPEDRDAGEPAVELSNARREGRATDERFHLRKDGSRFYCSGVTTRLGGSTTLGFAKIARDMTHQLEAQRELQQAHAGLEERVAQRTRELQAEVERRTAAQAHATNLLRKLVTAQEDQRASIARDLHDQLGQQLTALRLTLERHRDDVARTGENSDDLERAMALTQQIDKDLDFLAWELRPAVLDDLGLMAALPRFVRDWSEHYGITAEFRSAGFTAGQLSREVEVTFYRVAQEALNNVVKHAHASRVDVILESRDGTVVLVVEDDGVGFEPAHADSAHGIGLVGMRERAALSGANLEIESAPGDGTTIFLRSPVQPSNAPPESK